MVRLFSSKAMPETVFCLKPGQAKMHREWKRCEKVQVGEYFGESALLDGKPVMQQLWLILTQIKQLPPF